MPAERAAEGSTDPRAWRPMLPYRGRRAFQITDPVAEPFWTGLRVLVHVTSPAGPPSGSGRAVAVITDEGMDVADEIPDLVAAISGSVLAADAVIDGVISRQVGLDGVGAAAIAEMRDRPGLVRSRVDLDVRARGPDQGLAAEEEGLVAVDLLRVDGVPLLEVPLLERKRLLESVVHPDDRILVSMHVRPPIETWVATWKSIGMRGGMLKAANSRYLPGDDSIEWRVIRDVSRRHG